MLTGRWNLTPASMPFIIHVNLRQAASINKHHHRLCSFIIHWQGAQIWALYRTWEITVKQTSYHKSAVGTHTGDHRLVPAVLVAQVFIQTPVLLVLVRLLLALGLSGRVLLCAGRARQAALRTAFRRRARLLHLETEVTCREMSVSYSCYELLCLSDEMLHGSSFREQLKC